MTSHPTRRPLPHPHLQPWLQQVAQRPDRVGFYPLLRRLEALHPGWPRLGHAGSPADEPLRIGQAPEMDFAPAPLSGLRLDGATPELRQRIFGLLGPNGPMPRHFSELVRERALHHADGALQGFTDLLTHRFALLFYRAWAQAQPILDLERPDTRGFAQRFAAWFGGGLRSQRQRDALPDAARIFFTGRLARQVRDADGLQHWIASTFGMPARVLQWQPQRMPLEPAQRCRLQGYPSAADDGQRIGRGAVVGRSVRDLQHRFRIVLGPLDNAAFQSFLPGREQLPRLQALVRQWVGLEFAWDLQLVSQRHDMPAAQLGQGGRLGRDLWMHQPRRSRNAGDLVIDVERCLSEGARP